MSPGTCPRISGVILTSGYQADEPLHPRLLDGIAGTLAPLVDELIVVARNLPDFLALDALLVCDPAQRPSVLSGLHTGLFHAAHPHALVVCMDQPLPRPKLLQALLDRVQPRWDLIAPALADGPRPFPAVYAQAYHQRIEAMLARGRSTLEPLFKKARLKVVSEKVLRQNDPQLISFLKFSLPWDMVKIQALIDDFPG